MIFGNPGNSLNFPLKSHSFHLGGEAKKRKPNQVTISCLDWDRWDPGFLDFVKTVSRVRIKPILRKLPLSLRSQKIRTPIHIFFAKKWPQTNNIPQSSPTLDLHPKKRSPQKKPCIFHNFHFVTGTPTPKAKTRLPNECIQMWKERCKGSSGASHQQTAFLRGPNIWTWIRWIRWIFFVWGSEKTHMDDSW